MLLGTNFWLTITLITRLLGDRSLHIRVRNIWQNIGKIIAIGILIRTSNSFVVSIPTDFPSSRIPRIPEPDQKVTGLEDQLVRGAKSNYLALKDLRSGHEPTRCLTKMIGALTSLAGPAMALQEDQSSYGQTTST